MEEGKIKVTLTINDDAIDDKYFDWPQKYDSFLEKILGDFNLKKKSSKVTLISINEDEDEFCIKSEEDLKSVENIVEFKLILEEGIKQQKSIDEKIDKDNSKDDDENKEKDINREEGVDIQDNEGEDIEDFDPEEFKKYLENNIKEEDIKIDDNLFDEDYEKKLKEQTEKQIADFKNNLEQSINLKLQAKKEEVKNDLNLQLSGFVKDCLENQKKANNSIENFKEEFDKIKDDTNEILIGLNDFKDMIQGGQLPFLLMSKNQNQVQQNLSNIANNNNNHNNNPNNIQANPGQNLFINPNPLNVLQGNNNNNNNNIEEEEVINKIVFVKKKMNINVDKKKSGFFNIDNIEIKNEGTNTYNKLLFVKDEGKSSQEIEIKENAYNKKYSSEITLKEPFAPNN